MATHLSSKIFSENQATGPTFVEITPNWLRHWDILLIVLYAQFEYLSIDVSFTLIGSLTTERPDNNAPAIMCASAGA